MIKYGSVCSGIEAATAAWHSLGWKPAWFSEIEPFPCKVLKHHYPEVPNLGDMTKLNEHKIYNDESIGLLVGGTPCQSFSIAGLRGGMDDERGNLALEYCRILIAKQPKWFVWENVPGVFSSNSGKDFACLLSAFTGKEINPEGLGSAGVIEGNVGGYSVAWRVLDAQYFGVPQRRRRVFVVGHLGNDWRPSYAVLFERDSLRRDFEKSAKERKGTAGTVEGNTGTTVNRMLGISDYVEDAVCSTMKKRDHKDVTDIVCHRNDAFNFEMYSGECKEISPCLQKDRAKDTLVYPSNETVVAFGAQNSHHQTMNVSETVPTLDKSKVSAMVYDTPKSFQQNADGELREGDVSFTLNKNSNASGRNAPLLCQTVRMRSGCEGGGKGALVSEELSLTLATANDQTLITEVVACDQADTITIGANQTTGRAGDICATGAIARRLTPLECEILQGFPDFFTAIPGAKDSPRYAAIGNSMAVPVMHWIGKRIDMMDKVLEKIKTENK